MKMKERSSTFACKKHELLPIGVVLSGLLLLGNVVKAQEAIMSQPAGPEPAWQQSESNEFQVFNPEGTMPAASQDQPFQWGPVTARPHLLYTLVYATGLQSTTNNPQDTFIHEISPGILFDLGKHWSLDYTPTLRYYSNSHFKDELDQAVTFAGATSYEDWLFGLSQSYTASSSPQTETGTQTDEENYQTALTASYAFNSKMSLDMSLNQSFDFVDNAFGLTNQNSSEDTYTWSTLEWLNYEFWPRLNAGIGAGGGFVKVSTGPDQTFEQLLGRVNWRATDKISFQVNGGFEESQFLANGVGDLFNPIFGAAIQYQPFEQTQISLGANRTVSASSLYTVNEVVEITSVNCNLNQRLLGKIYMDLGAGYSEEKYTVSISTLSGGRTDDYYFLNARLSYPMLKRGTVAVTYQYNSNSSNVQGFSYSSNQVGFEVGYSY
jgi:hypothetical protein